MSYQPTLIRENIWAIQNDFVRCFFLKGPQGCILIDTGMGGSGLTEFCAQQAEGLPITLLITHADGDHCGLAAQFSRVRMHPADFDYYRRSGMKPRKEDLLPVFDGDTFTDGAHTLTALHLPGHTPGSTAYLETSTGLLFSGDILSTEPLFMFGPGRNVPALLWSLRRLQSVPFTTACCCHGDVTLEAAVLPPLIAGVEAILRGEGERLPAPPGLPEGVYILRSGPARLFRMDED